MRLFCTPTLLIYILFIHIVTAALHRKRDEGDTSLFELDEMDSNEDDTYRMIERMQDVSPEDQVEDDEMKEIERMDRQIQDEQLHIQEHESDNDNIPDEDEVDQEQDNDDEEEEIEEEEDDDEEEEEDDDQEIQDDQDIENEEIGPFDFKNDDEAEFFENLPISSPQTQEEEEDDHLKDIEEEEDLHNNTEDDEDELDELDEEEALAQATMPIPQESKVEAPIPWQRPNPYGKIDTSSFYQDENAIRVVEKSRFKVWHGITILVILVLAYRSLPRKKSNGLDLAWAKDEKDYLPLHNKGKYYKSEIKNC